MTIEQRAREILGLNQLEPAPKFLSMRVENLWRAEGFAPVVPFNGAAFLPLGPGIDLGALRDALSLVTQRHDVLHSRLALSGGRPVLVAESPRLPDLEIADVPRAAIAAHREGGDGSVISRFVDTEIDLYARSGLGCRLFRDEDGNFTLGVLLHHYFGDGWSSQVLKREISAAYSAFAAKTTPELGETAQYADYALAQRRLLSARLEDELAYWQGRLGHAMPGQLAHDHGRDTGKVGRIYFGVAEDLAARLAELARARRVSPFVLYLTALQLLQAGWSKARNVITAVNCADRIDHAYHNTVGYLIASLPVYTEMQKGWRLPDLFAAVAKSFYDGFAHRDLSYDLYERIFQPPQPFCATLFNFIPLQDRLAAVKGQGSAPPPSGLIAGAPVQRVRVHREIYFFLAELARGLAGKVYFNLDFFEPATVEAQLTRFNRILEAMARDPDGALDAFLQLP